MTHGLGGHGRDETIDDHVGPAQDKIPGTRRRGRGIYGYI